MSSDSSSNDEGLSKTIALAEQGDAGSQNELGCIYSIGEGVSRNYPEAIKWYRKAAAQGHAKAQYNLGLMYDTGRGVSKDSLEAIKWYRKAVWQGHAKA